MKEEPEVMWNVKASLWAVNPVMTRPHIKDKKRVKTQNYNKISFFIKAKVTVI